MNPSFVRFGSALCAIAIVACAAGCGGERDTPAEPTVSERAADPADPTKSPADPRAARRADAAAAVNAVFDGLRNDRPEAVWEFLPASYRDDVNRLVRDFARRIDPAVWNAGVANLRRAVRLLDSHRDLILRQPGVGKNAAGENDRSPGEPAGVAAHWDGMHALLSTLAESELADLERLKSFDGGRFLAVTGGALLAQSDAITHELGVRALDAGRKERFAGASAKVASSTADGALVEVAGPHGELDEVPFVLVEGKWVPRALRDGWRERIATLRRELVEELPADVERNRATILARFESVAGILDRLEAATTAEEFHAAFAASLPEATAMLREIGAIPEPPQLVAPEGDAIAVIVRPAPGPELEEELQVRFGALCDDAELGVAIPVRTAEGTRYDVSPVRDPAAFAKRIDFAKVTEVVAEERRIVIELPSPKPQR
ncbi:MAG: hypothetical protein WD066_19500 [Planctomycetaceae bacterium]